MAVEEDDAEKEDAENSEGIEEAQKKKGGNEENPKLPKIRIATGMP